MMCTPPSVPKQESWRERLSAEIRGFVEHVAPTDEDVRLRQQVVDRISFTAQSLWGEAAMIVPFGSAVTLLALPDSDIDLVMYGTDCPHAEYAPGCRCRHFLLQEELIRNGTVLPGSVVMLLSARVPLLKCTDRATGLGVDICFDVSGGPENAGFVLNELCMFPAMRHLAFVLKFFLSSNGDVFETYRGGMSSHVMLLLLSRYFNEDAVPDNDLAGHLLSFLLLCGGRSNGHLSLFDTPPERELIHPNLSEDGMSISGVSVSTDGSGSAMAVADEASVGRHRRMSSGRGRGAGRGSQERLHARRNGIDIERVEDGSERRTTVMICNVPLIYGRDDVIGELEAAGYGGAYDFIHVPQNFLHKRNHGHAFVNFVSSRSVAAFSRDFEGTEWLVLEGGRECRLVFSDVQGKSSLQEKFCTTEDLPEECHPVVLDENTPEREQWLTASTPPPPPGKCYLAASGGTAGSGTITLRDPYSGEDAAVGMFNVGGVKQCFADAFEGMRGACESFDADDANPTIPPLLESMVSTEQYSARHARRVMRKLVAFDFVDDVDSSPRGAHPHIVM